jgi:transcriptional regulator with XRE-family HTH domain
MSSFDLADFLIRQIAKLELTRTEVAKRAGFSRETLNKLLNSEVGQPNIWTLVQLAHALNVTPLFLIRLSYGGSNIPVYTTSKPKYHNDYSSFVRDVTYPDNSIVSVNQEFIKKWEIQNTGQQGWAERYLQCMDEDMISMVTQTSIPIPSFILIPSETRIPIPMAKPGDTVQIAVTFRAPAYPCTTISYWKMVDNKGELCFPGLKGIWCCVKVMSL